MMDQLIAGSSALRQALEAEMAVSGATMGDLTVLAPQNDPFRVDTPARHRDGAWLANAVEELGLSGRVLHLRGLHYAVLGWPKPDGTPYTNTDSDWLWLSGDCGKAARWLGYIGFDQISDQRNSPPLVHEHAVPEPEAWVDAGLRFELPDLGRELEPSVESVDFLGRQPYRLVMFGEKSSLEEVLIPLARRYRADLYLPTGEISDTLLHRIAANGAEDGRPVVVLTFSDADPAGWQMPVSIARKLQAFRAALFPELEFRVHRVALTPEQVRRLDLPSTPLKATEKRADRWRQEMRLEQTEIDALASLRPDVLTEIAHEAIAPFYDLTLERRVDQARWEWEMRAREAVAAAVAGGVLEEIAADLHEHLEVLRSKVDAANTRLRAAVADVELPEIVVPEPHLDPVYPVPLIDSGWSFARQCHALIASKAYAEVR